jgi:hypothetical protein
MSDIGRMVCLYWRVRNMDCRYCSTKTSRLIIKHNVSDF